MSFELNKIAGAILGTLVLVMGLGFLAEAIYAPIEDNGVGYALPEPEAGDHNEVVEEVAATPLPVLLASASAADGAGAARKCASCHSFGEGEGNKTGPALYDIVGREIAMHEGFAYSDAMIEYGAEQGTWTYEALAAFIHDPRTDIPGTKMTFPGIRDEEELADVLAYLQTLSASPVPFPDVEEVAEETPAEDEAAAEGDVLEADEAPSAEGVDASDATPVDADLGTDDGEADAMMSEEPAAEPEAPMAEDETVNEEPAADEPVSEEPAADEAESQDDSSEDDSAMSADEPADAAASELEIAIANASLEDGASAMRACRACHDWVEDGRNKVGPLLYDVVGREIASAEGFSYSEGMTAFGEQNGVWTYELLNQFIADPRGTVSGTKMTFGGVNDADDRAAVIALLRSQSPDPVALAGAE